MKVPKSQELIIVTGASTGIGAATAREMAGRGYYVLAGVRRDVDGEQLRAPRIEPVILDLTNPDHINSLVTRLQEDPNGRMLRALVNNAGLGANAPVEVFPLDEWRHLYEVNLFGHIAMIQAFLPALIRSRGNIVNVSSVGGKIAMAGYGPYAATKFGLEAVSDSLRREVQSLGVRVIVVEPSAVKTEIFGRIRQTQEGIIGRMTDDQRSRYSSQLRAVILQAQSAEKKGSSAEDAALLIATAITSRRPRTRYTVGWDAAVLVRLVRFLSDRALDRILAAGLQPSLRVVRHQERSES